MTGLTETLQKLASSIQGEQSPEPDAVASASPYGEPMKAWRSALKWIIAALGAVAAALVLWADASRFGEMTAHGSGRALTGVLGLVLAGIGTLSALGMLYWAQVPRITVFAQLRALAWQPSGPEDAELLAKVSIDPLLHAGTGSLQKLWAAHEESMREFERLEDEIFRLRLAHARSQAPYPEVDFGRTTQLEAEKAVQDELATRYHDALQQVAWLRSFEQSRRHLRKHVAGALLVALVAVGGWLVFLWSINPVDATAKSNAADQVPLAATLTLTEDAADDLATELGAACTALAATGGIPVVSLSHIDDAWDVVIAETAPCSAARVTITSDQGTVTATTPAA